VKPLAKEHNCLLVLSDEIVNLGNRFYIKATASLKDLDSKEEQVVFGFAREEETKKGMDGSQITGASSSYARKYALNGLFLIDDTKDSDSTNKDPKKSNIFDRKRYEKLVVWATGKTKEEVMQYILKLQKENEILEDIKEDLDLFISNLK
jgi:hypothetical protein